MYNKDGVLDIPVGTIADRFVELHTIKYNCEIVNRDGRWLLRVIEGDLDIEKAWHYYLLGSSEGLRSAI